jgi:hydrogenase large subunit
MASVRSLDNALETGPGAPIPGAKITDDLGVTQIPDNGRIIRNLIHGADTVMSHITHFYHLAALDFVDVQGLGAPFSPTYTTNNLAGTCPALLPGSFIMPNLNPVVSNYVEALTMRRKMHTASAIFSGRHPIQNAIVPGGVSTIPTVSDVINFSTLLDTVRNFINTAYVLDVVTVANYAPIYWTVGTGTGNLLSYGEYPIQTGTGPEVLLLERGLIAGGSLAGLAPSGAGQPTAFLGNVKEFVDYSYYSSPTGLPPSAGKTEPNVSLVGSTNQQYSWLKAPRFGPSNLVCEVGPLPRMVVSAVGGVNPVVSGVSSVTSGVTVGGLLSTGTYNLSGLVAAGLAAVGQTTGALLSTLGRHACRALECKLVADAMADTGIAKAVGEAWLTELRAGIAGDLTGTVFTNLTNPTYVYAKLPTKPKMGAGWAEAPRGALGHWISIDKKRIANYQCVVPSTWNHSPRDAAGVQGPAEQVVQSVSGILPLIAASGGDSVYISLLRLMHQWDFCIACAVHVVKPDGSTVLKFKMETDGRVTKLPNDAEI